MKILGQLQNLRLIPGMLLVWLAIVYLLPRLHGVVISLSPAAAAGAAGSFVLFDAAISRSLLLILNTALNRLTRQNKAADPYLFFKLPYLVTLILFFARRILTGVAFSALCAAISSSSFSVSDVMVAVLSGSVLAASLWLSPLALVLVVTLVAVITVVPVFLILFVISQVTNRKGGGETELSEGSKGAVHSLGYVLGSALAIPVFSFVLLQNMLPPNPASLPPDVVPDGLSAEKYLELGTRYKDMGWIFQAKMALAKAMQLGAGTDLGTKAQRFLDTKLPKTTPPIEATQKNIAGFNQMFAGNRSEAKRTFEELIAEYPDFEWPYSNLASIYLEEKNSREAIALAKKALAINPGYLNAWLRLAGAYELEKNDQAAADALQKATELDPDDQFVQLKTKQKQRS